jgi:peptidoglycan/LPS O-acetylase OafA/YrhL
MPLFFFLSGFFGRRFCDSRQAEISKIVKSSLTRLMAPYLIFSAIIFPLKFFFQRYSERPFHVNDFLGSVFLYPDNHPMITLWFVYVLFFIQIIVLLVNWIFTVNYRKPMVCFTILVCLFFLNVRSNYLPELFDLHKISLYLIFFFIGYLVSLNYSAIKSFVKKNTIFFLPFGLFYAGFFFFPRTPSMIFLYASVGIFLSWLTMLMLPVDNRFLKTAYTLVGDYSYDIYLLHYFLIVGMRIIFIQVLHVHSLAIFLLLIAVGLFGPIVFLRWIVRRRFFWSR